MENVQKWGFGMAPLKAETARLNREAICAVRGFVSGEVISIKSNFPDEISRVKGLFNRIIKQDQWDWFTINMYMDYPSYRDLTCIVSSLSSLRKAILEKDDSKGKKALETLVKRHFLEYCSNYLSFNPSDKENEAEYLYILSRREEKDVLKIGMTTRNVQIRVNEINSATGVVFPYSARKVYKVKDSKTVEKEVHSLLSSYRIRSDREFFRIDYSEACSIIEAYLNRSNQLYYN